MSKNHQHLNDLLQMLNKLRSPTQGCPWTRAQTFSSLSGYTIEEAFEVADAIDRQNTEHLKDELSDLLYHLVFYAQIAIEKNLFDLEDIAKTAVDKHRRRNEILHTTTAPSIEQVQESWELQKAKERREQPRDKSILADIPLQQPALIRATKLQRRAAQVGFDWTELNDVIAKLQEEIGELQQAVNDKAKQEDIVAECGDVLFCCANIARHLEIDPEAALRQTNHKFIERFQYIERCLQQQGITLEQASLEQMDALWDEAKLKISSDKENDR